MSTDSNFVKSVVIATNAAALVRYVVQSQSRQFNLPNLLLKSFRSKPFYMVITFQTVAEILV